MTGIRLLVACDQLAEDLLHGGCGAVNVSEAEQCQFGDFAGGLGIPECSA